jgi:hypothetical protein
MRMPRSPLQMAEPDTSRFFPRLKTVIEVVASISQVALAVLGLQLKERVDWILKKDELEVTAVNHMRELMEKALSDKSVADSDVAAALGLAAFGQHALPFLIQLSARSSHQEAARIGLRAVGVAARDATCDALEAVVANRTALYTWETKTVAVEVSANLDCQRNRPTIIAYQTVVDGWAEKPEEFQQRVDDSPPLQKAEQRQTLRRLKESLDRLAESAPRGKS